MPARALTEAQAKALLAVNRGQVERQYSVEDGWVWRSGKRVRADALNTLLGRGLIGDRRESFHHARVVLTHAGRRALSEHEAKEAGR